MSYSAFLDVNETVTVICIILNSVNNVKSCTVNNRDCKISVQVIVVRSSSTDYHQTSLENNNSKDTYSSCLPFLKILISTNNYHN